MNCLTANLRPPQRFNFEKRNDKELNIMRKKNEGWKLFRKLLVWRLHFVGFHLYLNVKLYSHNVFGYLQ